VTAAVFGAVYANAYDDLYQDKDYAAECDVLERVFHRFGATPVRRVLDLGCGTGGHASVLAERGYAVVGVDRSAAMLDRARERGTQVRYAQSDITAVHLEETFDCVVIMFAVLGYLTRTADVQAALVAARRHLASGGVLFFDVWYGPAVLAQRPSQRVKVIDTSDGATLIRAATGQLQTRLNLCTVTYRLWRIRDRQLVGEVTEDHAMRYFFEPELEAMLDLANFDLVCIGAFPDLEVEPSEQTWNVAVVARAR
jgi:SAM-dependent methyltransferase